MQKKKNLREMKSVMSLHSQKSGRKNRSLLAYTLWGKKHQGNIKGFFLLKLYLRAGVEPCVQLVTALFLKG